MCGRFSLTVSIEEICDRFGVIFKGDSWSPRYNIAPGQDILTITSDNTMIPMHWGLIPSWAKNRKMSYRMINARCETVDEKPVYKKLLKEKRCLIPADGFYEWKEKKPYRVIVNEGELFAFAGLWETWKNPESDKIIHSVTVITTEANSSLESLHDRMPVILSKRDEHKWLNTNEQDDQTLKSLLKPFKSSETSFYPVSILVNSWKNDSPECVLCTINL